MTGILKTVHGFIPELSFLLSNRKTNTNHRNANKRGNIMDKKERNSRIASMVIRYNNGDEYAFSDLYNETASDVHRFCRYCFKNMDEQRVDDVVNSAYEKISRKIQTLDKAENFLNWAFEIIRTTGIDILRAERKYVYFEMKSAIEDEDRHDWIDDIQDTSSDVYLDDNVFAGEIGEMIINALSCLSDDIRRTFCLYYFEELKIDEIAGILGVPFGTVQSRLFTARKKLRDELKDYRVYIVSE